MQPKVKKILDWLTGIVSSWDGIAAIVLGEETGTDTYDPYFNINIDVYFKDGLLSSNQRRERFNSPGGFETSPLYPIDRFFVDDLPVGIFYKDMSGISLLIKRIENEAWVFRHESTNLLYRIQNGEILFSSDNWLEELRERLTKISDKFWQSLMEATRFSLDNHLNGIGAAVYRNDLLFYQTSASGFCQSLCSYIFALNRMFEPAGCLLHDRIRELKRLPDEFLVRFESLIRPDSKSSPERKFEIAKLLARSISSP